MIKSARVAFDGEKVLVLKVNGQGIMTSAFQSRGHGLAKKCVRRTSRK